MGACCEPQKAYVINNGNAKTRNLTKKYSNNSRHSQQSIRSNEKRNQGKGRISYQNIKYDGILDNKYLDAQVNQGINLRDLDELPIYDVANLSSEPLKKSHENINNKQTSVSSCNPNVAYSLYDSKRGKKSYQSTYPKMPA